MNNQDISDFSQDQFDKAVRLSSIVLAGAERFTNLQLELSRKLLAENAQLLKTLSTVKDPKSLADLQGSFVQPSIDQAFSIARNVYDVALDTQQELVAFVEEQLADNKRAILSNLDRLSQNTPGGSDVAVSALKTLVNTSTAAFESVSKTAKKVSTEIAEASVEAATHSAKAATAAMARKKANA